MPFMNRLLPAFHSQRLLLVLALMMGGTALAASKPSILIIDGRNNHDWRTTTESLRATLNSTGLFEIEVSTAPENRLPSPPKELQSGDLNFAEAKAQYEILRKSYQPAADAEWAKWLPDFSKHAAVVLNYNGPEWPKPMQQAFINYVRNGGGVMLIHAANNAFANWTEFNDMIGLGWRKGGFGQCLIVNQDGSIAECCQGDATSHGSKHPFVVTNRVPDHPVLRGLPTEWLHAKDELYHHLRGPAKNVTILASAFSEEKERGSGRHEPVLYETTYGQGRVLVSTMGHAWLGDSEHESLQCVGFQTLLTRGVEYVATGKVTLPLPSSFPTKERASILMPNSVLWSAQR
ncbi:ThuA domain-containing protein [soil metagenome]